MLILFIIVWGLAIGWIAQFIVFGAGRPTALALFAGLAGSFVGGLLDQPAVGRRTRPEGVGDHRLDRRRDHHPLRREAGARPGYEVGGQQPAPSRDHGVSRSVKRCASSGSTM